jgi:hypothetical protein
LTNKGFGRLKEIVVKYEKSKKEPIGKTKELIHALNCLSEEEKKKILDNL